MAVGCAGREGRRAISDGSILNIRTAPKLIESHSEGESESEIEGEGMSQAPEWVFYFVAVFVVVVVVVMVVVEEGEGEVGYISHFSLYSSRVSS